MSAYIEKDKLVEWLKVRSDVYWWYDETNDLSASYYYVDGVREVLCEVKKGTFDWHGESE